MADAEERKNTLNETTRRIAKLAEIDAETLARTSELSPDINFKEAVPHFKEMLDLCAQLNQRDLTRLTTGRLDEILNSCTQLEGLIQSVREFDLNQNTPRDVCQSIVSQITSAYNSVMDPLLLPLAFTATQATDYAKIEREAKGYHATMKAEADNFSSFIKSAFTDAERALAAVKEQAAEAGVSTNAQIFLGDSKKYEESAKDWWWATISFGGVTVIAAVSALITAFMYHPPDLSVTIQYVVAKILVLSTLSFSVVWCVRNYRAQKHNETLNKHRANALLTFRAFVEGTSDERVKDAILLQASQAAFSGRKTGFESSEKDPQNINPVVEILGKTLPKPSDA